MKLALVIAFAAVLTALASLAIVLPRCSADTASLVIGGSILVAGCPK